MKNYRQLMVVVVLLSILVMQISASGKASGITLAGSSTSGLPAWEEFSHPAGWRFWLPDGWKVSGEGDNLSAEDKSGTQFVEIYVPKSIKSLDSALDELDKELSSVLKNIKVSEPINAKQNGINVTAVAGTGVERKEGVPMTFTVGIYEKKGKLLIVFGGTASELFDKFEKPLKAILDSVK